MGKGRKMFRKKAAWVTYKLDDNEEFYQLNIKGELIKQDNKILPHHVGPIQIGIKVETSEDISSPSEPEAELKKDELPVVNRDEIDIFSDILDSHFQEFNIQPQHFMQNEVFSSKGTNFWVAGLDYEPLFFL
ncbi:hypothetical protein TVAG_008070 [Trichomonas vaginalis G3]|uniref:Uncharacterized protein n=1 Tax=Trichomonas vaginalis (strain ATCC PRA-98 / G3) TaxID=412133 RepID=A2EX22_TRIV3|nr:hypothetical protein TVAGG3_0442510 [Trichomonas vaginalis G3]EAY02799.1 hypothetical protein TVAG_008070 [Trichomonas vaginalis G3]KAI5537565.1 hypothetical protein TVAGG3_0442510 [Trichomonas vaginalis G3]|eukprot:XP_001315022.1 hypothetical protein [Trichomonas vaginalis G3]